MKKNLILPIVLFGTATIFGIGKSISFFSDSVNDDAKLHSSSIKENKNTTETTKYPKIF